VELFSFSWQKSYNFWKFFLQSLTKFPGQFGKICATFGKISCYLWQNFVHLVVMAEEDTNFCSFFLKICFNPHIFLMNFAIGPFTTKKMVFFVFLLEKDNLHHIACDPPVARVPPLRLGSK
jgi:hypothetical protein